MPTTVTFLAFALALAAPQTGRGPAADDSGVRLSGFIVSLIDDVNVAAREPGILTDLAAHEGQLVKKGDVLGQIDDSDAQVRRLVAENQLAIAAEQAASDANVKAAIATVEVAKSEYEENLDIKQRIKDAVSDFELRRKKLTQERSDYERMNAELEQRINALTRDMRAAQLQAVENEIVRRHVESPIDGVVVRRLKDPGEWVQAGDSVFRIVRMDRLRVEGLLDASRFTPRDVDNQPVLIEVGTPSGVEKIQANITFVSPVVDAGGEFLVFAEFDNPRTADGQWLIRPGLKSEITILLKQAQTAATRN